MKRYCKGNQVGGGFRGEKEMGWGKKHLPGGKAVGGGGGGGGGVRGVCGLSRVEV